VVLGLRREDPVNPIDKDDKSGLIEAALNLASKPVTIDEICPKVRAVANGNFCVECARRSP
jgi:hypothetical protein